MKVIRGSGEAQLSVGAFSGLTGLNKPDEIVRLKNAKLSFHIWITRRYAIEPIRINAKAIEANGSPPIDVAPLDEDGEELSSDARQLGQFRSQRAEFCFRVFLGDI